MDTVLTVVEVHTALVPVS
ncbi:hypothetical protein Gohar_022105 [Gossypium harknessii]|uniref:Uncharacterized protein n=1 Tax=Gossypium harknessii TaxID=34285 RepID=A0A7J9I5I8_9ROSI|nr:hypothetical protein [Gossypium harknessii]